MVGHLHLEQIAYFSCRQDYRHSKVPHLFDFLRAGSSRPGQWATLLISSASPTQRGAPLFAFCAKGREPEMLVRWDGQAAGPL